VAQTNMIEQQPAQTSHPVPPSLENARAA